MRIIAITNQKGGSGKTTTAVNLAASLADRGRRVLLVDLDPQCSATSWLCPQIGKEEGTVYDVFLENVPVTDVVTDTPVSGLELVPASPFLVGLDRRLAGEPGAEMILRSAVRRLRSYDYVLFDCPPALGLLTLNALTAAREILVPVEASVMALAGLAQLWQTVGTVRDRLNPELRVTGIVACRVRATRHAGEVVAQLRERFPAECFPVVIRENVRLTEAPSFGQAITAYDRRSRGAEDYASLASAIIGQE